MTDARQEAENAAFEVYRQFSAHGHPCSDWPPPCHPDDCVCQTDLGALTAALLAFREAGEVAMRERACAVIREIHEGATASQASALTEAEDDIHDLQPGGKS